MTASPVHIIAFRPDQTLYYEVMEAFYKANTIVLSKKDHGDASKMGRTGLQSIKKMIIDTSWATGLTAMSTPVYLKPICTLKRNIEDIHLDSFRFGRSDFQTQLQILFAVAKWTKDLKSVKRLITTLPPFPRPPYCDRIIHAVATISAWLGATAKLARVTSAMTKKYLIWIADEGRVLWWKNPEYSRDRINQVQDEHLLRY